MARRTAALAPVPDPQDEPQDDAATTETVLVDMDWDTLPEPVAMPERVVTVSITPNVLESVPMPIRKRAEASLSANAALVARKAGSTSARKRVSYRWDVQRVATEAMGHKFVTLITKYSKYRPADKEIPFADAASPAGQVTTRCGKPSYYVTNDDGTYSDADASAPGAYLGVRYSTRPFEARKSAARVPGSA